MAEDIKNKRSISKRKVTNTIRKLTSSLKLGAGITKLNDEATALEGNFDELNTLHLDYEDIAGQDKDYLLTITEEFNDAMSLYYNSIKEEKKIQNQKEASTSLQAIESSFTKLNMNIERLQKVNTVDYPLKKHAIEVDRESLNGDLQAISDNVQRVSHLVEITDLLSRLDQVSMKADTVRRNLDIVIKESEMPDRIMEKTALTEPTLSPSKVSTASKPSAMESNKTEQTSLAAAACAKPTAKSSHVQIKRIELPNFSGDRRDWPEFKAMFKHLAEATALSEQALAYELKRNVKGPAWTLLQSVYCTKPDAYKKMWAKLGQVYDDPGAAITAVLSTLHGLNKPGEDFKSFVSFIDEVEACYAQLEELDQLSCVSVRDIDIINGQLPINTKMEWNRRYNKMTPEDTIQPFKSFMSFLEVERAAMIRVADPTTTTKPKRRAMVTLGISQGKFCFLHHSAGHSTEECRTFIRMPTQDKFDLCRTEKLCFRCLLKHGKNDCTEMPCETCGKSHHKMMCPRNPPSGILEPSAPGLQSLESRHQDTFTCSTNTPIAVLPIARVKVHNMNSYPALTLFDSGSDATYITFQYANKIGLKPTKKLRLDVTTMGNIATTIPTSLYQVPLVSIEGTIVWVEAFGLKEITGKVSRLDQTAVQELFPNQDCTNLQRHKSEVDMLVGCDNFGLHPKKEIARAGENLSIMSGKLGICLQGAHMLLREETKLSSNLIRTIHGEHFQSHTFLCKSISHPLFIKDYPKVETAQINHVCKDSQEHCLVSKATHATTSNQVKIDAFIKGEELGTTINPKCGSCRCGKCPMTGHTYSFVEQQELEMIRNGLRHDEENERWITSYPWLVNPSVLPQNYSAARSRLVKLEKSLTKDPTWAASYQAQLKDMLDRGVARKLDLLDMQNWTGPYFYISHLAVNSPKSASTPIRIVFNSSQIHNGISLNGCLAKGPDSYTNNILGLLLRWRENRIAMVADIKKMFHSIYLEEIETHCHRYLWRDMDTTKEPDVYVIQRVNMGDKPASAIATEALRKTATLSETKCPRAAELINRSTYMDDLIDSKEDLNTATDLAQEVDKVLQVGGFHIKCWQFSLQDSAADATGQSAIESQLKGVTDEETAVLGVNWNPVDDNIVCHTSINFSKKSHGARLEPDLTISEIAKSVPEHLTRRMVLQQTMAIYDPLGLLCPFTLKAKILLRKTWELKLGWDEALPSELRNYWILFFVGLYKLEGSQLERSLTPKEACEKPWLIIFSDGSELAYGFAAYIRWKLKNGKYWCRLVMAKSRIAPLHKTTTPRMELNGAVLSKRARQVIGSEMRIQFEKVVHLIDSQTVLNMLHKTSTRFQIYEGSRIGEIQAVSDGNLSQWAWLPGENNIADHVTRGLDPEDLTQTSDWWMGPPMLYKEYDDWNIKHGQQNDERIPGEKVCMMSQTASKTIPVNIDKYSKISKARLILARLFGIARAKSFTGGSTNNLSPELLEKANDLLIQYAQADMQMIHYKALNPTLNHQGVIVVGSRMSQHNPMSLAQPQILLPTKHELTKKLMKEAHEQGHLGRDGTLAKFRQQYWTPHGDKLAKGVKTQCQECRLRDAKLLEQGMGQLPKERLTPGPPFNATMLDFLGPFLTRGEVQKRISGKCWLVLFTDLASRAVHLECTFGYDVSHFLLAFSRFVHIRGWPSVMYSDPGSQLVGAEKELRQKWNEINKEELIKKSAEAGTKWIFGPADSPWHQGAVEALVKVVKKCLQFAVHGQRLTPAEYLTTSYEIANMVNERPIGFRPSVDSQINILTPNSLLLGRSSARNPGKLLPDCDHLTRFSLVRSVAEQFWKNWIELYVPSLMRQAKWQSPKRNIQAGDVVLVAERSFKGDYKLAKVLETFPGTDGLVRKVSLIYKNYKPGEPVSSYKGASDTVITRSVQRLALIVSEEEVKRE